jgi:hypothetical protein
MKPNEKDEDIVRAIQQFDWNNKDISHDKSPFATGATAPLSQKATV